MAKDDTPQPLLGDDRLARNRAIIEAGGREVEHNKAAREARCAPFTGPCAALGGMCVGVLMTTVAAVVMVPSMYGIEQPGPHGPYGKVYCNVVGIPNMTRGAYVCRLAAPPGELFPLMSFGHGDLSIPAFYEGAMMDLASYGFVVAAYRSCTLSVDALAWSACKGGEASFLEHLKVIRAFTLDPGLSPQFAPVDMSKLVTIAGHSTGGRSALMVAAVRDSPQYLAGTPFAQELDADDGSLRKAAARVGAVLAFSPDDMGDPRLNPDTSGFVDAITETPTFIMVTVADHLQPQLAAWRDFCSVRVPNKIYLDLDAGSGVYSGHLETLFGHKETPWAAHFARAFTLGEKDSWYMLYGGCPTCMRRAVKYAQPGQYNTGNNKVGLLLCAPAPGYIWPAEDAALCSAPR